MKHFLSISLALGLIATACAPRPTGQGGTGEFSSGQGQGSSVNNTSRAAPPDTRDFDGGSDTGFRPNSKKDPAPDYNNPLERTPGEGSPEYFFRRDRYQAISI